MHLSFNHIGILISQTVTFDYLEREIHCWSGTRKNGLFLTGDVHGLEYTKPKIREIVRFRSN